MSYIDGAGGGGGAGTGTVTNVATTAPVAGGPITTTGTISITGAAGQVLAGAGPAFTATPTLGVATTTLGTLSLCGNTSGTVIITPQAAAGTPTLTLPTTTGTLASSASSPLVLSATTGVLTAPTAVTSAAALTANNLVIGAGSQASAALGSLGTTTTLLHGNAAGAPTFAAVSLTADVSGVLPGANGGVANITVADQGGFWSNGGLGIFGYSALASSAYVAIGQQVRATQFVLAIRITVRHVTISVNTAAGSAATVTVGIYDAAGTTKLIDSGTFDGNSNTVQTLTISDVTLNPGCYWFAHSASTQTTLTGNNFGALGVAAALINAQTIKKMGLSSNTSTAGVLPSSLGTISALSYAAAGAFFEP